MRRGRRAPVRSGEPPDLGSKILLDGVGDRAHGPALVKGFVVGLEIGPAEVVSRVFEHLLALDRDRRA